MKKNKNSYLIFIPVLFLFFIILMVFTLFLQNRKKTVGKIIPSPNPTLFFPTTHQGAKTRLTPKPTLTTNIIPTTILPTFTGVEEEKIPQEIVDFSQQKLNLIQRLPLKTTNFSIDFDYENDKFIVKLNPPKEESQKKFEDWLKNNYFSTFKDLFIFQ